MFSTNGVGEKYVEYQFYIGAKAKATSVPDRFIENSI